MGISTDHIYAFVVQDGLCLAARHSGLYRRDGDQWVYMYERLGAESRFPTTSAALSPDYAHDHTLLCGTPGGILRSVDGGISWQISRLPDPPSVVSGLLFSPMFSEDHTVIAATLDDGVYRSEDGGKSWRAWNFGLFDLHVLCLTCSSQAVLAGTETGIFMSRNFGKSWQALPMPQGSVTVSTICSVDEQTFLVGTESEGLYELHLNTLHFNKIGENHLIGHIVAVLAIQDRILAMDDACLWISDNEGAGWHCVLDSKHLTAVAVTKYNQVSSLLVATVDGQIEWHAEDSYKPEQK